jgi:hypothetical protein
MKTIEATVSRANDGFYSIFCNNEMFSGGGDSAEEAKNDMLLQMDFFKKTAIKEGFSYPKFLDDEFVIVYKFDVESLLQYYSGILSLSGIQKITGIHQKQLWSYLHGNSKPRKPQAVKIEKALQNLGKELISISL